jgi:acetylornithine/N-succinyldiaminopimelate aminotransferase
MREIVQGEGGVQCLDAAFVQAAARVCAQHNLLLIVDEVQTGNGRTGALYSYMHYGIQPDIVTTAKGLGGGLPIGATLLGEKVKDVFSPGSHGSTFGGNPVCCAGALSVLRRLNEPLFAQVQEKSAYIFAQLADAPGVKSVSGLGLMIGVEPTGDTDAIVQGCREQGVLVIKAKSKIRLLPALNIPFEQLAQAVAVLKAQCALF